jgi:glycosyltransferase involved in cell wall biosynthesis
MSDLQVLVDPQVFRMQEHGGISRYFVEMLKQFRSGDLGIDAITPFRLVRNRHLGEAFPGQYRVLPAMLGKPAGRLARAESLWSLADRLIDRRGRASDDCTPNLVHHTYYLPSASSSTLALPRVCTIYDMIPEMYPELFPEGNPHADKAEYIRACSGIICISETTRCDLEQLLGPTNMPTAVIHLGVGQEFHDAYAKPASMPWPYVIYVGQRSSYKNASVLIRAWPDVAKHYPSLRLLFVGSGPMTDGEQEILKGQVGADRIVVHHATDAELPGLYAGAQAFVFPSRYEGFGLPVLEAFAAGTPTLLSTTAGLREVGGDAAAYFDADSPEALAGSLLKVLDDRQLQGQLVAAGRERAATFTWRETARKTADFYRRVVEEVA